MAGLAANFLAGTRIPPPPSGKVICGTENGDALAFPRFPPCAPSGRIIGHDTLQIEFGITRAPYLVARRNVLSEPSLTSTGAGRSIKMLKSIRPMPLPVDSRRSRLVIQPNRCCALNTKGWARLSRDLA